MFPEFCNRQKNKTYLKTEQQLECDGLEVKELNGIFRFTNEGSYASLFGDQWKQYRFTQLDSYSGVPISAKRLNRCLGLLQNDLKNKLVLEAGCGAGRFTEILLEKGAFLVSSDLSSAVDVNQENFPQSEKHLIIQADINDMPFADDSFDVVVCLGVIQHTPNPEQTISNLYKLVKRGGSLVIDHYSFNRSHYFRLAPLYRRRLKSKSAEMTIPYTQQLVKKYLPLHKKFAKSRIMSMLLNRISPVISYYRAFPQLNETHQQEWAMLDTHDSLTDWHKHFRSKRQIFKLLVKLGATDIWCEFSGNAVEARCKKP